MRAMARTVRCGHVLGLDRRALRVQSTVSARLATVKARALGTVPPLDKVFVDVVKRLALHANGVVAIGLAVPHTFFPGNA
ncbi:hypothetical protein D3C71_1611500 [compost metagenome]